jgi:hypothetical protein
MFIAYPCGLTKLEDEIHAGREELRGMLGISPFGKGGLRGIYFCEKRRSGKETL